MLPVTFFIFAVGDALWIGEEYWTTVSSDGSLLGDRTVRDFLTFHTTHLKEPARQAYVAFWVVYDEAGHYETFGHAYLVENGVCARFLDRHHKAKTICGGLEKRRGYEIWKNMCKLNELNAKAGQASIHEALEYRGKQMAKIVSWRKDKVWYGSACMKEALVEGIEYENEYVKISYVDDPFFYQRNVYILVICNPDDPEAGKAQHYAYHHVPKKDRTDQKAIALLRLGRITRYLFRTGHIQRLRFNQQRQRRLRHKQPLNEQQITSQLKNRKKGEQFGSELGWHQQRYKTISEQQMDDEADEKWEFYQHSRRL
ncbi:unnamed protein product [Litomosoides sigmodontis]|uniref:Uncharacterized protein n=1 Tax=Litomosoides sigmodontis TaxID=42156 RepID=A0A3P6T3Z1_LITSI|nr:unnamed protein product [Litomosoides sigmodontis]